jgi:hypothetical protein
MLKAMTNEELFITAILHPRMRGVIRRELNRARLIDPDGARRTEATLAARERDRCKDATH